MPERVLITGGAGFIGSHLVDSQLARSNHVRIVDLNTQRLAHLGGRLNLEIIAGDITDEELIRRSVEGVDIVYHLASAHLDVSLSDQHYYRVNVDGTVNLLKAAKEDGVHRFVHCSSVGVIGDVINPPADETSPCNPTNIYEKTKLAGEQAALAFGQETGLPVVVARPAWVYGPRCPRTAKLFRAIRKGRFPIFGTGDNLRHPVYVSDAVHALELCAQSGHASGQVYIIAGDKPVSTEELVRAIAATLGVNPPLVRFPMFMGMLVAYTLEIAFKPLGHPPPFSRRSLDFFLKNNAYDIARARQELGFDPKVDLHSGLQKTWRWLVGGETGELRIKAKAHG